MPNILIGCNGYLSAFQWLSNPVTGRLCHHKQLDLETASVSTVLQESAMGVDNIGIDSVL